MVLRILLLMFVILLYLRFEAYCASEPKECQNDEVVTVPSSSIWMPQNSSRERHLDHPSEKSCLCGDPSRLPTRKIIGGNETTHHEFPWMVALYAEAEQDMFRRCGGSLINDYYVLTAAHCVEPHQPSQVFAIIGEHDTAAPLESQSFRVWAESLSVHPEYDFCIATNDIALIRLKEQITFSFIAMPICLPTEGDDYLGETAIVAGWGKTESDITSNVLLKLEIPIQATEMCGFYPSTILCGGKDLCQGDSGGPMMLRRENYWEIIGIASRGADCADPIGSSLSTRVNQYLDWIATETTDAKGCTHQ